MRRSSDVAGPDFLCIGAQKAGTSWLYINLGQHPSIWLPPVKEVHYFNGLTNLTRMTNSLNDYLKTELLQKRTINPAYLDYLRKFVLDEPKDDRWYRSLFAAANGRLSGDCTPAYSTLDEAAVERVQRLLPDARIIFIMRNPIDRAWSHLRLAVTLGQLDIRGCDFDDLVRFLEAPASELRTRYVRTLGIWEQVYPPDQLKYLFFDDIGADPEAMLKAVCVFLDIDFSPAHFARTLRAVVNKSAKLPCPPGIKRYLAAKYHGEIVELERRFGGYASRWLMDCEAILA